MSDLVVTEDELRNLTERAGRELCTMADEQVATYKETRRPTQPVAQVPKTAVVLVDDGRAQIRNEGEERGIHGHSWTAPKYASLESYDNHESPKDPHPEVPAAFLHKDHVRELTDQIHNLKPRTPLESPEKAPEKATDKPSVEAPENPKSDKPAEAPHPHPRPPVLERTCLASTMNSEDFGYRVSAEAARRRFYEAPRRAFVADGERSNWTMFSMHFPGFTPILDFIHLLTYLHSAAMASRKAAADGWELYVRLVTHAWQGRPLEVLKLLVMESERLGSPPEKANQNDPRRIVAQASGYVKNNLTRMDYPQYRKLGLPVTSCHIESMIKRFNWRVKASDKFWVVGGLDAVLHLRAAWLSEGGVWQRYWEGRPQRVAASYRPYRSRAG